ncbi:MAG: hypothetical protein IJV00_01710 [Clostridia bacterium]|nr:hypothetical protein [Clostridia bacterium]
MNFKRASIVLAVFVLFALFAFLCAVGIAEGEIIESYRWMVYLGVTLALSAFYLFAVFGYLFVLIKVRREAARLSKGEDAAEKLGALLEKHRAPALRSAVSLELASVFLKESRPDRARSILMLIDPGRPILFDKKLHSALLEKCGDVVEEPEDREEKE